MGAILPDGRVIHYTPPARSAKVGSHRVHPTPLPLRDSHPVRTASPLRGSSPLRRRVPLLPLPLRRAAEVKWRMLPMPPSVATDRSELTSTPSEAMVVAPLAPPPLTAASLPQDCGLAGVHSARTGQCLGVSDIEDSPRPPPAPRAHALPSSLPLPRAPPSETFQDEASIESFLDTNVTAGAFRQITRRASSAPSWRPTKNSCAKGLLLEKKEKELWGCC